MSASFKADVVLTLHKHFVKHARDETTLLGPLTMEIVRGSRVGITGPSGCGKSTMLREICGAMGPSLHASIKFSEMEIDYVGQKEYLFPWYTPRKTVFALRKSTDWCPNFDEYAKALGISDKLDKHLHSLSGGERQRVGLWSAFCRDAKFLILDEPLTALDLASKFGALQLLSDWLEQADRTLLVVSHDFHVLSFLCDRIIHVRAGSPFKDLWLCRPRGFSISDYLANSALDTARNGLLNKLCEIDE